MRISQKNSSADRRSRRVSLFLNPGQAAADQTGSSSESSSQAVRPAAVRPAVPAKTSGGTRRQRQYRQGDSDKWRRQLRRRRVAGRPQSPPMAAASDGGESPGGGTGSGGGRPVTADHPAPNRHRTGDGGSPGDNESPGAQTPVTDTPANGAATTRHLVHHNGSAGIEPVEESTDTTPDHHTPTYAGTPAYTVPAEGGGASGTNPPANTTPPATDQSNSRTGTNHSHHRTWPHSCPANALRQNRTDTGQTDNDQPPTQPTQIRPPPQTSLTETGDTHKLSRTPHSLNARPRPPGNHPADHRPDKRSPGCSSFWVCPPSAARPPPPTPPTPPRGPCCGGSTHQIPSSTNQTPTATPTLQPTIDGYTISLNATDPDCDPLTTTIASGPANGTAVVSSDGTIPTPPVQAAPPPTTTVSSPTPAPTSTAMAWSLLSIFTGRDPHTGTSRSTSPAPTNQAPTINLAPTRHSRHSDQEPSRAPSPQRPRLRPADVH